MAGRCPLPAVVCCFLGEGPSESCKFQLSQNVCLLLAHSLPSLLPGRSVPTGRELGYSICQRREAEALRLEGQGTKHCLAVRTRAWWLNGSTAQQRLEQMYVNADGQPVYPQAPSHTENILETKTQSQVSLSAGVRQPLG